MDERPSWPPPATLGYRSEAAFARAFKRVIGRPPGAVKYAAAGT